MIRPYEISVKAAKLVGTVKGEIDFWELTLMGMSKRISGQGPGTQLAEHEKCMVNIYGAAKHDPIVTSMVRVGRAGVHGIFTPGAMITKSK